MGIMAKTWIKTATRPKNKFEKPHEFLKKEFYFGMCVKLFVHKRRLRLNTLVRLDSLIHGMIEKNCRS